LRVQRKLAEYAHLSQSAEALKGQATPCEHSLGNTALPPGPVIGVASAIARRCTVA
jgi:hypothetical protein